MNIPLGQEEEKVIVNFYRRLLQEELYTDLQVIDEVVYISKKKYGVPPEATFEFLEQAILSYVKILPIGENEYIMLKKYVEKYKLKPSDAIHLAVIDNNNIAVIATEDKDFDKTHIKRIWINK